MFLGTPAGALRSLRVSDPAQEVNPHSQEALPGEVSHRQRTLKLVGWLENVLRELGLQQLGDAIDYVDSINSLA